MHGARISTAHWDRVEELLRQDWSPEQASGWLAREEGIAVSHEWIYQYVYADKRHGGDLYKHLRCQKPRRKRYGSYDRRGQIKDRVSIDERPAVVERRSRIGDWNTAYHHGALIQDTVLRPTFLDFEDGNGAILPMHLIGLMGMGKVPSSAGELNYSLMLGNRSSLNTNGFTAPGFARTEIDVNNVADKSDQKMFGARLVFKSSRIPLEVGVFGLHNPIAESGAGAGAAAASVGSELIAQTVYGGHFRYATPRFDVMGETYSLSNDDKAGNTGKHKAAAYYVQFGYRTTDTVKLIYRFEDVDFVAADPYFQYLGTPEGSRHVVDLRYDIDDTNALKFEIVRFEPVNSTVTKSYNFYAMQWAFLTL